MYRRYWFAIISSLSLIAMPIFSCTLPESSGLILYDDFAGSSKRNIKDCHYNPNDKVLNITLTGERSDITGNPWYAFKLSANAPTQLNLAIKVNADGHQYAPRVSADGLVWRETSHWWVSNVLNFSVSLTQQLVWISAQEMITSNDYKIWGEQLAQNKYVRFSMIGESVQQRPIYKIEASKRNNNDWLVIIGRQHPPELTGVLAMVPFVSTILSNSPLANQFRQRYNVIVLPNVNPDGVDLGYWRLNANLVDLDRDWQQQSQPEVQSISQYLKRLARKGARFTLAIDFHAANKHRIKIMPGINKEQPSKMITRWLSDLDQLHPNFPLPTQKAQQVPGSFMTYFARQFDSQAVSVDLANNGNRKFIKTLAVDAANSMMRSMLQQPKQPRYIRYDAN
ncbi:M14 family zinc carboxypeptidase [Thalassotalea aquiviva]|uniref:M14 family zinc carboxypeptidase n=1 Tax=Thalassotalea aquiviva TaxID=3242415 RepID=UPI00352B8D12